MGLSGALRENHVRNQVHGWGSKCHKKASSDKQESRSWAVREHRACSENNTQCSGKPARKDSACGPRPMRPTDAFTLGRVLHTPRSARQRVATCRHRDADAKIE